MKNTNQNIITKNLRNNLTSFTYLHISKTIFVALFLISNSVNFSFAADEIKQEVSSVSFFSIAKQIKNIFNFDDNKTVATTSLSSLSTSTQASSTTLISTSSDITLLTSSNSKIINKKDRVSRQIKSQIQDKNRLIESMISVSESASSSDELKIKIDASVLELESAVSDIIKDQKNLIDLLDLNTKNNDKLNEKISEKSNEKSSEKNSDKTNEKNNLKIKKLEESISKKSQNINTLIKVDIKNILENI